MKPNHNQTISPELKEKLAKIRHLALDMDGTIYMGTTLFPFTIDFLNEMKVPFEVNALSAHRTPEAVEAFSKGAKERGVKIIIAAAGMAAHLPGVIAASTTLPVIGVPINSTLDGMDALLAIVQMPPGIPVATVGVNASPNAAILAVEMLSLADAELAERLAAYKENLKKKIEKANEELKELQYEYKTN